MSQKLKDQSMSTEVQAASLGSRRAAGGHTVTDNTAGFNERIQRVLEAAFEKKALDVTILDLRELASFTDYFVIASGTNKRQVQAISDEVVEQLKRNGTRAERVEGYRTAEWILVDYGDFLVHVFDQKARRFYDLERLWREAKRIDVRAPGSELSHGAEITDGSEPELKRSVKDL
jgi:ribosome-associated protein